MVRNGLPERIARAVHARAVGNGHARGNLGAHHAGTLLGLLAILGPLALKAYTDAKKADRETKQGLVESYIHGGRIGAVTDLCTHQAFPMSEGTLEPDGTIECAWHGARFDCIIPRAAFTPDRLFMFVQRYEARTGQRAAISDDEKLALFRDKAARDKVRRLHEFDPEAGKQFFRERLEKDAKNEVGLISATQLSGQLTAGEPPPAEVVEPRALALFDVEALQLGHRRRPAPGKSAARRAKVSAASTSPKSLRATS